MAFPTTGLLDNFNRANESPMGGSWSILGIHTFGLDLNTNQALNSHAGSTGGSFYNVSQFGGDSEAYATVATLPAAAQHVRLWGRLSDGTISSNGYQARASVVAGAANDTWQIFRTDSGTSTQVGATVTGPDLVAGDKIGFELIGSTLQMYRFDGSSWTSIISRSDATYSAAGYIAATINDSTARLGDFSGGTVVSAAGPSSNPAQQPLLFPLQLFGGMGPPLIVGFEGDVPAAGALSLDASGGTATAGGGTAALSFTYAPGSGAATAGGGTAAFSETLAAAAGAATAGGEVSALSFTYSAAGGSATAGGGSVALSRALTAASGAASAGGGVVALAFTFAPGSGTATAAAGTAAPTFVYGASGGGATAGGGDASVTVGGGFSGSASGGTATAGGGATGLAFSYTAVGGAASASGGSVTLDIVPAVVTPPVETGPTGGRYEPGGDETSIYGRSVRVVSRRGHAVARGSRASVSTRSRSPLRVLVPPRRERVSVTVTSDRGAVVALGSTASVRTNCTASSHQGTAVTGGSVAVRVLASSARRDDDGDLTALALLGVL